MSSRPRRSAAQKASVAITDMADRDNMSSSRGRRAGDGKGLASVSRSGQGDKEHTFLNVKLPASKLRQATTNRQGSSISVSSDSAPKRSARAGKKNYVVEETDEDEDEEEGEDEIQVGAPAAMEDDDDEDEEMDDADADADADADDDADGDAMDDEMDIDAEGDEDEDAEGEEEVDMTPVQPAPVIKISKPAKTTSPSSKKTKQITPKKAAAQIAAAAAAADNSDDDELSDLDSDDEDLNLGDEDAEGEEEDEDMDAEGEEIEEEPDADGEADEDLSAIPAAAGLDSDDDGSETPDLSKMTQRQRARFEGLDESHYQALSNEVQAKKTFTIEEKAMRRAEMARRRRNLSEKRNEEVKQETINKLLKKQASKTNRKSLAAIGEEGQEMGEDGIMRANPVFIRWTSNRDGNRIAIPAEMMEGPAGQLFVNAVRSSGGPRKMVEEVA